MKGLFALGLGLALAASVSLGEPGKPVLLDGVAAYVNGDVITISEVMNEVHRSLWQSKLSDAEKEARLPELYRATLEALIDRRLILAAARESKVRLQSWAVEARIRSIIDDHFAGDKTKLAQMLSSRQMTYEEWAKSIEDDMVLSMMRHTQVDRKVRLTPGAVRSHYEKNREKFVEKGGVQVRMITLKGASPEAAKESMEAVLADLRKGEKFADVAKRVSKDDKASKGGECGTVVPEDVFAKPLVEALAKVKPGEVTEPVYLENYAFVLLKEGETKTKQLSLEEAWRLAEMQYRFLEQDRLYKVWTERLRKYAYIKKMVVPGVKMTEE